MLSLPFDDNFFDAVLAFRLLPHVYRWQLLIAEMCRVARYTVVFDYPDIRSFNYLYRFLFNAKKAVEGNTRTFRLFKRSEINHVLRENHFGQSVLKPQFFAPMVVHRLVKLVEISKAFEFIFKAIGLTSIFGSPVIFKASNLNFPLNEERTI